MAETWPRQQAEPMIGGVRRLTGSWKRERINIQRLPAVAGGGIWETRNVLLEETDEARGNCSHSRKGSRGIV